MFAGYEEVRGKWCVNVKLEEPHADLLLDGPRVVSSQYLGGKRWVSLEAASIEDWGGIRRYGARKLPDVRSEAVAGEAGRLALGQV
ncbi:MAG TPA: hypothetical protein VIP09_08490 [Dehalococcoidia bacterium]|jgi:hypothetical protein